MESEEVEALRPARISDSALGVLHRFMDVTGFGTQRIVGKRLGTTDATVSRLKKSDASSLTISRFEDLCNAMGLSPSVCFKQPGEPVLTRVPPIPRKAERRLTPVEHAVQAALTCQRSGKVLKKTEIFDQLEALDELRYASPLDALSRLEALCARIRPPITPYVLAMAASCFRMMERSACASRCLVWGQQLAKRFGDRFAEGELYQRAVYFFASIGIPTIALDCAERAALAYARLCHRRKLGESFVDMGFCYYQLQRWQDCVQVCTDSSPFRSALSYKYRAARLQHIGASVFHLGDQDRALEFIRRARIEASASRNNLHEAKALWAEGWALGGHEGAEKLEKAIEFMANLYPIDAALASTDLCKIHLSTGRVADAYSVASRMTLFVQPLLPVPAASHALRELILLGTAAHGLTVRILDQTTQALEQSRTRYYQRVRQMS